MNRYITATLALAIAISVMALMTLTTSANGQEVCAEGGDWSQHQEPEDFGPVDGAVEYCVKGGSDNSQGCIGYLEYGSFDEVEAVVNGEEACGLSHWSYRLDEPDPTDVPDPTPTEEPTQEPTQEPTPTEEPTNEPTPTETPTVEPTPTEPGPTPTDLGPTPTDPPPNSSPEPALELPSTGDVGTEEVDGTPWLFMLNGPTQVWAGHNQSNWPAGAWFAFWEGVEFEFNGAWYTVTDYIIATPDQVELIYSTEPDLILITCRGYDKSTNTWAQRLVIYADLSNS